jgi:hypothetical protein
MIVEFRLIDRVARLAAGCAAVVGCAAAVAPAAQADTMVYVKDGTVFLSQPDGSQARPITTGDNAWAWPSETDGGIIAVAGGLSRVVNGTFNPSGSDQVYEFDQQGNQLSGPVNTTGSYSTVNDPEYVSHFRVAPDNSNIAWTALPSYADATTVFEKPTGSDFTYTKDKYGALFPYSNPEWWGNSHLLFSHDGVTLFNEAQYGIYNLNDGSAPGWGQDEAIGNAPHWQVAISRDGLKFAVMTDDGANYTDGKVRNIAITLETTTTPPSGTLSDTTDTHCTLTLPASEYASLNGANLASMSFSSDGSTLAWGQDDGIYEANVSDPNNCQQFTSSVHKVVAGGEMPFLSPAALSPLVPKPKPTCGSGGTCPPAPPTCSGSKCKNPTPTTAPNTRLTGFKLKGRKHSATVRFTGMGSGKLSFQCKLGKGSWHSCRSPMTLKHLSRGSHKFEVRARDAAGRIDPTPAAKTFRVR